MNCALSLRVSLHFLPFMLVQFTLVQKIRIVVLPQRLVQRHRHRIAQIQAAGFLDHGQPDAPASVFFQEILRQTLGLFSEEQVAVPGKLSLGIALGGFGGQTPKILHIIFLEEVFQILIVPHIHQVPVIQSCPLDGFFGNIEAQGSDQMKPASGGRAGPGNVTAVLGDLRLYKYNIQHRLSPRHTPIIV